MTEILWLDTLETSLTEEVSIESMTEEWSDFYELFLKPCLDNYCLFIKHQDTIQAEWAELKSKQTKLMDYPLSMLGDLLAQYRRCVDSLRLLKHTA
jgi:hypothetical protein